MLVQTLFEAHKITSHKNLTVPYGRPWVPCNYNSISVVSNLEILLEKIKYKPLINQTLTKLLNFSYTLFKKLVLT